jgi:hypothetical protein
MRAPPVIDIMQALKQSIENTRQEQPWKKDRPQEAEEGVLGSAFLRLRRNRSLPSGNPFTAPCWWDRRRQTSKSRSCENFPPCLPAPAALEASLAGYSDKIEDRAAVSR